MTVIRVDPQSVRDYGRQAQGIFDTMHGELVTLVNDVVAGPLLRPERGGVQDRLRQGGGGLRQQAERRHGCDGRRRSHVDVEHRRLAGWCADHDPARLEGDHAAHPRDGRLRRRRHERPRVVDSGRRRNTSPALRSGLKDNLGRLQGTDWEGNAKIAAVDAVSGFTTSAQAKCDTAEQSVTNYIRNQIEAVTTADR